MLNTQWKAHPWHGVAVGPKAPDEVNAYIEIVPTDTVKYEIDKETGHLRIDRPQRYSSLCPTLYGFVPQTYCGHGVGKFCADRLQRSGIIGDGDPVDICVISERTVTHGDILLTAVPIGGLRIIDRGEADDKIIAVLASDGMAGEWKDIWQAPRALIDRLTHYFLTYKAAPDGTTRPVEIAGVYGAAEAREVITHAIHDYQALVTAKPPPQVKK
ncbi:MAG: inorganic pyrophosphatase [Bdellovibrionota bacterium]|nr:MAG: inorganic pyrophosphatase [Bdellovibrionota bacterium]